MRKAPVVTGKRDLNRTIQGDYGNPVFGCPACFPDLSISKNNWESMMRKVYNGNKIYDIIPDLNQIIINAWLLVEKKLLENRLNAYGVSNFLCYRQ
ncbi:hypothetical protein B9Z55_006116 [Caenorhabditis nigoni]|uniref:Tc1-like transposase DDE domain-containing protein n=1 Tax=Caenorhabditis nigoni TaxID=1611254 RepID=A0A2G5V4I0_9PELO|nr:hypothetical protein B9Z55_006116 [Caenorhabditis nigoni]